MPLSLRPCYFLYMSLSLTPFALFSLLSVHTHTRTHKLCFCWVHFFDVDLQSECIFYYSCRCCYFFFNMVYKKFKGYAYLNTLTCNNSVFPPFWKWVSVSVQVYIREVCWQMACLGKQRQQKNALFIVAKIAFIRVTYFCVYLFT